MGATRRGIVAGIVALVGCTVVHPYGCEERFCGRRASLVGCTVVHPYGVRGAL